MAIEPEIGEIITINGVKYITQATSYGGCRKCAFLGSYCADIVCGCLERKAGNYWSNMTLSFPTKEMAEDFLNCFRGLCDEAKTLL